MVLLTWILWIQQVSQLVHTAQTHGSSTSPVLLLATKILPLNRTFKVTWILSTLRRLTSTTKHSSQWDTQDSDFLHQSFFNLYSFCRMLLDRYGVATRLLVSSAMHQLTATLLVVVRGQASTWPTTTSKLFSATTLQPIFRYPSFRSCETVKFQKLHSATSLFISKIPSTLSRARLYLVMLSYNNTTLNSSTTPQ